MIENIKEWIAAIDMFVVFLMIVFIVFAAFIVWLVHDVRMSQFATCDYFASTEFEDVPIRCIRYWTGER